MARRCGRALAGLVLAALAWRAAPTTRIPQDMDKNLLNIIKHNLRRNNDDYGELRPARGPAPRPGGRAFRRDLDTFEPVDFVGLNDNKQNTSTEESGGNDTTPISSTLRPEAVRPMLRRLSPAQRPPTVAERKRFAGGRAARPRPPLRADLLDMAPATGNRMIAKRAKGRLCQRHVLLPEGPKYDSWGTAYLLAHGGRRPFAGTREPRLLLPACCNCCRKSALGCE